MSEVQSLPTDKIDAVVIGSGAVGSAVAARLAAAGKEVLIIEAGPRRSQVDLVSSAIWARRLKWSGAPVIEDGDNPIGHAFNAGSGTGGSAMHHYAVWPRMHESDFDMQSRYQHGLDWPIGYADLAPYYDAVQLEAGVSGDAKRETWRPAGAPYPMPPVPAFEQGNAIARGFVKRNKTVAPLPLAVTSVTYNGRPSCLWDGWCDAGCPIGALANPLTVHLPIAFEKGAKISHNTEATRILTNAAGDRATGVEVVLQDGSKTFVHADLVVLAAFAVQNPRLLLASANSKHPKGIGNTSDIVGRYIMTHTAGLIYGLFEDDTNPHKGAFGGQFVNQDSYDKLTHDASGAFGSYQWMIAQAVKPNDLLGIVTSRADLYGSKLHDFMKRAARKFAGMTAVVEGLPVASNRVQLSTQRDVNGNALAKVTHSTHEQSQALWQASLVEGSDIFEAAGAQEVWTGPPGSMHIMGGTIMGSSVETSVTNSYGQIHEVPNLVIAGPGLFPTSAGVNPTFTAHALAARSADYLIEKWSSEIMV